MSSLPQPLVRPLPVNSSSTDGGGSNGAHAHADAGLAQPAARHPLDAAGPDVVRVLREDGTLDPAHDPGLSVDEVVSLHRAMVRTRLLDDRLTAIQRQGRIGFHIGSLGEEAA